MSRALIAFVVGVIILWAPGLLRGEEIRRLKIERKAGAWTATVEAEPVGSLQARAIRMRQKVTRQGPGSKEPQVLFEETSTGRVQIFLREDGLLLIQPVARPPAIVFPMEEERVDLELPTPRGVDPKAFSRHMDAPVFLNDGIFYHRKIYPDRLVFGFIRIDSAANKVADSKNCLEVIDPSQDVVRAAQPLPLVFQVGDLAFWVNKGHHNVFYPDLARGEWKSRKLRILNIKTNELVDPEKIPTQWVRQNEERIWNIVEKEAHNRSPEVEIWAVGALAKVGGPHAAARLKTLESSVVATVCEVAPNEIITTDRLVKAAYARALEVLDKSK